MNWVASMKPYRVHGMMQSYFTRKMTGYLDYKGIAWVFRRFPGASPEAAAAGFPGGVPVVETPDGAFMWDSTAMIHHLELRFPEPAVLPTDPVQRFLCYLIEDVADEWLYRPAVGTRWLPDTLLAVLADLKRVYLPWVSRACTHESAAVVFDDGTRVAVRASDFLRATRATLLARYAASRSARLDAFLERAGILAFFADYTAHAGSVPDFEDPPRPVLNRPFPPAEV